MSNGSGLISSPVSIDDVKAVLGVTDNDLATLCKSPSINMWARHKPVDASGLFNEEGHKGRPVSDNYVRGVSCYGIMKKGCMVVPASTVNVGGSAVSNIENGGNNFYRSFSCASLLSSAISYDRPTGGSTSPYRLGDFAGYLHDFSYPKTNGKPYRLSTPIAYVSNNNISFGATLLHDWAGTDGYIGVGDMFGSDKGGKIRLAVVATAAYKGFSPSGVSPTRTKPLSIIYFGDTLDGGTSSKTGLDYMADVTSAAYSYGGTADDSNTHFSSSEYIYVAACVAKYYSSQWYLFELDSGYWFKSANVIDTTNYLDMLNTYGYVSMAYNSTTGIYTAYIDNYADLHFEASGQGTLACVSPFNIAFKDGSYINIQSSYSGYFNQREGNNGTHLYNAYNVINQQNLSWSEKRKRRVLAVDFKINGSHSTLDVGLSFSYKHRVSGTVTTTNYSKFATINVPTGSNVTKTTKIQFI